MVIVENSVFVDVLIDGNPIPDSFNLIGKIVLTEGNGTLFPACMLIFNDLSGNLTQSLNLTDGNSISVTVGKSVTDVSTVTRQYRLFGLRQQISPAGPQIVVVGIYDAPKYITSNVSEGYRGPSTEVLRSICKICQIEYEGPDETTNDSQTWLCVCKNRASFAQDVVRHGYVDKHSAMSFTLTSLGVMRYKNLARLIEQEPLYTFYHNVPPGESGNRLYPVKQARDSSTAGMINSWQNYGSTKIIHNLSGSAVIEDKIEVKTSGKYLPINKQIQDTVQRSRIECSPLDCSNVNSKYERALYQNVRLLGLFCEKVSVLVTAATDVQVFDTVYYRQADADMMLAAEPSDIYLVIGKTVYVKGSQSYAERLELVRMSVTNKGAVNLATQDPSSLREFSLPDSLINSNILTARSTSPLISLITSLFATLTNQTRSAYSGLGQVGSFGLASITQLAPLVSAIAGPGISQTVGTALTALPLINASTSQLSSSVTSLAGNYRSLDSSLGNTMTQISGLPLNQLEQVNRAGLQQASLFNPSGIMSALAIAMPLLGSLSRTSSMYSSVQQNLNRNSEYLTNSDPSSAQHLNEFNAHSDNISTQYASLSSSVNNIWNKCVCVVNKQPIPKDLYNYAGNTQVLDGLSDTSLTRPPGDRYKVTPLDSTVNSMSGLLQSTDNDNRLLWMYPPSPIVKTYRYPVQELPSALDTMKADSNMLTAITRENST